MWGCVSVVCGVDGVMEDGDMLWRGDKCGVGRNARREYEYKVMKMV